MFLRGFRGRKQNFSKFFCYFQKLNFYLLAFLNFANRVKKVTIVNTECRKAIRIFSRGFRSRELSFSKVFCVIQKLKLCLLAFLNFVNCVKRATVVHAGCSDAVMMFSCGFHSHKLNFSKIFCDLRKLKFCLLVFLHFANCIYIATVVQYACRNVMRMFSRGFSSRKLNFTKIFCSFQKLKLCLLVFLDFANSIKRATVAHTRCRKAVRMFSRGFCSRKLNFFKVCICTPIQKGRLSETENNSKKQTKRSQKSEQR